MKVIGKENSWIDTRFLQSWKVIRKENSLIGTRFLQSWKICYEFVIPMFLTSKVILTLGDRNLMIEIVLNHSWKAFINTDYVLT